MFTKLTERVMRRKAQYIRNTSFFIRNINTYQYIPIEKQIGLHSVKLNDIKLREFFKLCFLSFSSPYNSEGD